MTYFIDIDCFLLAPAFKDLNGKPIDWKDEFGNITLKERYVRVTTDQLAEKTKQVYGQKSRYGPYGAAVKIAEYNSG